MNEFGFRGHYLLTPSPMSVSVPNGWTSETTRNWRCLYREGETVHAHRTGPHGGPEALLIGHLIDPAVPDATDADLVDSIVAGYTGPMSVAERLHVLSGRFVLLIDTPDDSYVFHDACGLRPVYFGRTRAGLGISSDPAVQGYFGLIEPVPRPGFWGSAYQKNEAEWWIPSGISLVEEVDQLPPNHYLQCSTSESVRYYPHAQIGVAGSSQDVVTTVAAMLRGSVDAAARRWRLALPLTAGVDSRTVLASARGLTDTPVYTLQLGNGAAPSPDVAVAAELCRRIGAPHQVLRGSDSPSADFEQAYVQSTVNPHFDRRGRSIWSTRASFPDSVILNGNGLEVARCFYYPSGSHRPITTPRQILDLVIGWRQVAFIAERVQAWYASTRTVAEKTSFDILDLFYWEHRMGGWAAQNFVESGIAHEIFAPFNNRALLELLLTVPVAERCAPDYRLFRRLWQEMWPELLAAPVNPGARDGGVKAILARTGLLPAAKAVRWHLRSAPR
jgi:hypothetical protein